MKLDRDSHARSTEHFQHDALPTSLLDGTAFIRILVQLSYITALAAA